MMEYMLLSYRRVNRFRSPNSLSVVIISLILPLVFWFSDFWLDVLMKLWFHGCCRWKSWNNRVAWLHTAPSYQYFLQHWGHYPHCFPSVLRVFTVSLNKWNKNFIEDCELLPYSHARRCMHETTPGMARSFLLFSSSNLKVSFYLSFQVPASKET